MGSGCGTPVYRGVTGGGGGGGVGGVGGGGVSGGGSCIEIGDGGHRCGNDTASPAGSGGCGSSNSANGV